MGVNYTCTVPISQSAERVGERPLPRRLQLQLPPSWILPPAGTGGETDFADVRTAFDELPPELQTELKETDYIAAHSLWHSRKAASPSMFAGINPEDYPMGRHKLVQKHEASGRETLYLAVYIHHIEGLDQQHRRGCSIGFLSHATQPRDVLRSDWNGPGDLVVWDNTCVMHWAVGGSFEGRYRRDMRRARVHDGSSSAWVRFSRNCHRVSLDCCLSVSCLVVFSSV